MSSSWLGSSVTAVTARGVEAVETAAAAFGLGPPYFLGAGILSVLLAVAHLLAPRIRRGLGAHAGAVGSLGGGMAAAYAFLHLIPELHEGRELLGVMIYAVPLLGLIVHLSVQRAVDRRLGETTDSASAPFLAKLANLCVYNWLIVYATPAAGMEAGWWATPIFVAILLHLVHNDYAFGEESGRPFDALGRYFLAGSALLGYAAIVVEQRANEALCDILTAFLAGSVLFNVFREEIPPENKSKLGWFVIGAVVFAGAAALSLR